jgi:hypothetical protein
MGGSDVTGVGGVGGESGTGVYDDATKTVGDGTTSADHESVSAGTLRNQSEDVLSQTTAIASVDGSDVVILDAEGERLAREPDLSAALSTAWSSPHIVRLREGTYPVDSTIDVPVVTGDSYGIVAPSPNSVTLSSNISDGSDIISSTGSSSNFTDGNILQGFEISGTGSDGRGIYTDWWVRPSTIRDISVSGVGEAGVECTSLISVEMSNIESKDNSGDGFRFGDANACNLNNLRAGNCVRGLRLTNCNGTNLNAIDSANNSDTAVLLVNGCSVTLNSPYTENNAAGNPDINVSNSQATVTGGEIEGETSAFGLVNVTNSSYSSLSINDCDITNNGSGPLIRFNNGASQGDVGPNNYTGTGATVQNDASDQIEAPFTTITS